MEAVPTEGEHTVADPAAIDLDTPPLDPRIADALFELGDDLLCIAPLDGSGQFSRANSAWQRVLGWTPDEVTARPFIDLVHPDDLDVTIAASERLRGGNDLERFRNRYRTRAGDWVRLEWTARVVDTQPPSMVAIGHDATARHRNEHSISTLVQRLQTLVEDERGRIAGELHDYAMQTLVAALMQARSTLDVHATEPATTERLVHGIEEVERLLASTVDSLRGVMNGLRPLWVEHLEFDDVVAQLVREVQRDFPISVDCTVDVSEPVPAGLRLAAYRVLRELVVNAAKHADVLEVELRVEVRDGRIDALVRDGGAGFAQAVDMHESGPGSGAVDDAFGLGLSLALERISLNGGSWRLQSAPGAGTTVQVRMPLRTPGGDGVVDPA